MVDEDLYCARCGRMTTRGAVRKNGKVYGPCCVKKVPTSDSNKGNFKELEVF
jgi:hypothetical protein